MFPRVIDLLFGLGLIGLAYGLFHVAGLIAQAVA